MNHRERILALTVLAVAILGAEASCSNSSSLTALSAVHVQTVEAEQDLNKKKAEEKKENDDRALILTRDPARCSGSVSVCRRTKTRRKSLKKANR